ncbi:competence type IV pilus minor pilin ComGF [Metabacillus lacus]|nr:competence type IV pilus minor pilin ComGF [Metabacillus lacus]
MYSKSEGYTFPNMLLSLLVFILIAAAFPLFLSFSLKLTVPAKDLRPFEWHLAVKQLQREFAEGRDFVIKPQEISFKNTNGQTVSYQKYASLIRRQVDGKGHEVILQNIYSISFLEVRGGTMLTVNSLARKEYTASFRSFAGVGI